MPIIQTNKGLCRTGDIYKGYFCPDYIQYAKYVDKFSKPVSMTKENREKLAELRKLTTDILVWECL